MRAKFSFHDKAHLYSIRVHLNLAGRRGPRCVDVIYAKEVTRHAPFDRIDINRFTEDVFYSFNEIPIATRKIVT